MSNFLNKISQAFSELTPSHRAVASYISENIDSVAFKTLEELAEDIGVSTTTVIRFAKTMGYDGFSPMQKEIQSEMRNKAALPERLNQSESIPDNEILKRTMANDIKNIELTFSALDDEKTNETVETIESGKKIYVLDNDVPVLVKQTGTEVNLEVECKSHINLFHTLFFTLHIFTYSTDTHNCSSYTGNGYVLSGRNSRCRKGRCVHCISFSQIFQNNGKSYFLYEKAGCKNYTFYKHKSFCRKQLWRHYNSMRCKGNFI